MIEITRTAIKVEAQDLDTGLYLLAEKAGAEWDFNGHLFPTQQKMEDFVSTYMADAIVRNGLSAIKKAAR